MGEIDIRILTLIELLREMQRVVHLSEFCDPIGLKRQNLSKIKKGQTHFTIKHISSVIRLWDVNANWLFGTSNLVFKGEQDPTINSRAKELLGLPHD